MRYTRHVFFTVYGLAFILLLPFSNSSFGQNSKLIFQSVQQGLSHQQVRCFLKDSRGFVWIGTHNGLNRFDGTNFTVYENNPDDLTSLSHNAINAILEDKNHNIWICTSDGLDIYNREKDNFLRMRDSLFVNSDMKWENTVFSCICEDNDYIWLGTSGIGVIRYNVRKKTIEYYKQNKINSKSIQSNYISCILKDKENKIWIGTLSGLDLYEPKTNSFRHFNNIPENNSSLSNNHINALTLDKEGNLWIGTLNGGLNKLIRNNYSFTHYRHAPGSISSDNILSLIVDHHNNLWIGTDNEGLNCLNIPTGKITNFYPREDDPQSVGGNTIRSLYVDDLNILWIGTYNRGFSIMDERYNRFEIYKKNFLSKQGLNGNDVRAFAEDHQGNVWIATDDGGICRFNLASRQFTYSLLKGDKLSSNAVTSIILDSNENLWVGTWTNGIDRFNKNMVKTGSYKLKGIQKTGDNKVMILYQDHHKNIWAGTNGSGLFIYDKKTDSFIAVVDESKSVRLDYPVYVTSILEDKNERIWVATMYGLFCLKNVGYNKYVFKRFYRNSAAGSISSNGISTIFEDHNARLWFGSADKGLNLLNNDNQTFTVFRKNDGLPDNSISGILEDDKGDLWISTDQGICKFNPTTKKFKNYSKQDGLPTSEFYENACLKVKSGEFLFGGNDGFTLFQPDRIRDNMFLPTVCLTDLKIFNKSARIGTKDSPLKKNISETRKITLTHKQSSFTIEFVALNYLNASQNQYAYILEGLEKEWNQAGHKKSASYTFVKPGKYLFKVKAANNDGIWNNIPTTLEITILPPFWRTYWAFAIYFFLFSFGVFLYIRVRDFRIKQMHILELNQMKLQFFANISHELRTPLSLIVSPIENMLTSSRNNPEFKDQLSIIHRNANHLLRLVNELMDFTKAEENKLSISAQPGDAVKFIREIYTYFSCEAFKRSIDYRFEPAVQSIEAWFDQEKLEKIILNLLSNSFKFTPDQGSITIKVEKVAGENHELLRKHFKPGVHSKEWLQVTVTDNGRGIPKQDLNRIFDRFYQSKDPDKSGLNGTGIGLALTKSLVDLHYGKIFVSSEKWKETSFVVLLPLGFSHFKKSELLKEPADIHSKNLHPVVASEIGNELLPEVKKDLRNAPAILIVEDNYELRSYIRSAFASKYNVLEASDGKMGLDIALEHTPDLIISDVIMPQMTGTELCKKLKGTILTSHIPVILLTAKITMEDQIEGIETGADVYITKPFNVRYLKAVAQNLMETRQKLFQRFSQEVHIIPKEVTNNPLDQDFLEKTIRYIEDNILSIELSVENLSSHLLMSQGHTWRKIKSLTGLSTNEFIRTIRLKKAIKLIEENRLNISEIAYNVGFTSPAYFTKCFRKQYGKSPSEYFLKPEKEKDPK